MTEQGTGNRGIYLVFYPINLIPEGAIKLKDIQYSLKLTKGYVGYKCKSHKIKLCTLLENHNWQKKSQEMWEKLQSVKASETSKTQLAQLSKSLHPLYEEIGGFKPSDISDPVEEIARYSAMCCMVLVLSDEHEHTSLDTEIGFCVKSDVKQEPAVPWKFKYTREIVYPEGQLPKEETLYPEGQLPKHEVIFTTLPTQGYKNKQWSTTNYPTEAFTDTGHTDHKEACLEYFIRKCMRTTARSLKAKLPPETIVDKTQHTGPHDSQNTELEN